MSQLMKKGPAIIEETADWIAVNKPAGLLSIPDREGKEPSLKQWLQERYENIYTVHRLDKDTSGIIVFARNEQTHKWLSKAFEDRTMEKYYLGIVMGQLPTPSATIDVPIMEHPGKKGTMTTHHKGKPSVTDYELLEELGKFSLVRFRIHTGRTHQIRVHMQYAGHPLVCDELYGDGQPIFVSAFKKNFNLSLQEEAERPILGRLGLHAWQLFFTDAHGQQHKLEAEPPKDIRALLQQLRKRYGK